MSKNEIDQLVAAMEQVELETELPVYYDGDSPPYPYDNPIPVLATINHNLTIIGMLLGEITKRLPKD